MTAEMDEIRADIAQFKKDCNEMIVMLDDALARIDRTISLVKRLSEETFDLKIQTTLDLILKEMCTNLPEQPE